VDVGLVAPFDGGYRAWRAAIGEGWTVAAAVEAESRRLRTSGSRAAVASARAPSAGAVAAPASGAHAVAEVAFGRGGDRSAGKPTRRSPAGPATRGSPAPAASTPARKKEKLSKDSYRRQKASVEAELTRLGLRKAHLELALSDPAILANFVELRRITSELADVGQALHAAEVAWLEMEERAP
jgi:hypothetical protein